MKNQKHSPVVNAAASVYLLVLSWLVVEVIRSIRASKKRDDAISSAIDLAVESERNEKTKGGTV